MKKLERKVALMTGAGQGVEYERAIARWESEGGGPRLAVEPSRRFQRSAHHPTGAGASASSTST